MNPLEPGDPRQLGRYRITGRLGGGGMGQVYLGRSPSGRLVAVKVVRPELAQDPGFRRRFAREVAAARKVNGFFTAAVVDADPDAALPWLATAHIPGPPLDEAVAAHGPWPVEAVRALGAGLAEALEAIHAAGLVHRDLKPSNVLIAPDGPRVVDFGISVAAEATALTRTGMTVGTPGFMAPEQLLGTPVTAATDVFALGAVLTFAATGTGPFGSGSAQALNFRIAYEEPDVSGLPAEGLEVVVRCLAKDPAQRPTVAQLIEELGPVPGEPEPGPSHGVPAWTVEPTIPVPATPTAGWPPSTAGHAVHSALTLPAPVPAAGPAVSAPVPQGRAAPFWVAIAGLVLGICLPPSTYRNEFSSSAVANLTRGSWPWVAGVVLSVGVCVAVLIATRRTRPGPLPRWPRRLHVVSTLVSLVLLVGILVSTGMRFSVYATGAWAYIIGCAALVVGLVRFPRR